MMTERPVLGWSDLAGKRVGVWGFGREGGANLRKLRSLGVEPVLVDDDPAEGAGEVLRTADGGLDALLKCDVVVKTPGLSRYRPEADRLRDAGVVLAGGLGLWLAEADRERVVVVTGTKGKSTTSSIIGHLLNGLGQRAAVGGNIGVCPYDPDLAAEKPDYWVVEVSSYQATDLAVTPPVTALTSLHPDHLPWHGDVERYYRDKLSALSRPGAALTVANGDEPLIRERVALLGPRVEWVGEDDDPGATWMEPLHLPGRHNRRNALIARAVLRALGIPGASGDTAPRASGERAARASGDTALRAAAEGYEGLPSRLKEIGVVAGVRFVDDSLSTNVLPTLAALDAFPGERVALIVGGQDRGIDYAELAEAVGGRQAPTSVRTLPDSGPRISRALKAAAPGTSVVDCPGLEEAVRDGFEWARPDGVVLLSPAAPSFGRFRDYRDRGDAFARAMRNLDI
ncbi:MAG: UDP-N-acetylmuramoyl-L-alanine--D-glutamate ligase [Nocardiopsaceae bacterium]|nr:UDP-N-acetylmuramoyl-L-alanine--D-glutamate ligase [Nocardiopsaceae bacterium]